MIIRIQSKNGTRRINVSETDTLQDLKNKTATEFGMSPSTFSFRLPNGREEIGFQYLNSQLQKIPVSHGDMLFMVERRTLDSPEPLQPFPTNSASWKDVKMQEDDVDKTLAAMDGKVHRKKDPQMCRHGDYSKCINCVPLEPWDRLVQEGRDPPIKHLSFHCHMRKLTSGVDRGKFAYMEDLSCKIKTGCTDHLPWPSGICTKCQPSAITLARQIYRHVDNVMFDDGAIVDRFIEGWRKSGDQRFGYLLGHYTEFTDVPLGIRVVVSAIYEPPQVSSQTSLELKEDNLVNEVDQLAKFLGLRKVGWIFTDLEAEANEKVAYKRSVDTYIMSAEECIMAADFQNRFPSPCRLSRNGNFGSKFVTICVSGDENNQISLKGYQVSNQCMALVRDNCLVPTFDAPELGYVRESTSEQYVPDVFYKSKDEYGEVTKIARPLPLEYLIIELTTTTPIKPSPLLPGGRGFFPTTNRDLQDFEALSTYINQQFTTPFLEFMADFHLLLFLYKFDMLGVDFKVEISPKVEIALTMEMAASLQSCQVAASAEATVAGEMTKCHNKTGEPYLPELCDAIRRRDESLGDKWMQRDCWATVKEAIKACLGSPLENTSSLFPNPINPQPQATIPSSMSSSSHAMSASGSRVSNWSCRYCTFLNPAHNIKCDVCDNSNA